MKTLRWISILAAAGCVAHRPPPPLQTADVADGEVSFRAFGRKDICENEPRFLLDELSSVNGALARFLLGTLGDEPSKWPESRIARVSQWREPLPHLLEVHAANLEAVAACRFAEAAGFPYVRSRGAELLTEVQRRQQELDRRIAEARAQRAEEAWAQELKLQRTAARSSCPVRLSSPRVYFAWRERDGISRYLFCDGSRVERSQGVLSFEPGDSERYKGKRPQPDAYLAAARLWPESRMLEPPKAVATP